MNFDLYRFLSCSHAFKILPSALVIGNWSYLTQKMGGIRKELCPNSPNLLASLHLSPPASASLISDLSFLPIFSMLSPPTYSKTPVTLSSLQHWILPVSMQTYCCIPHLKKPSWPRDPHPTAAGSSLFFPLQGFVYMGLFPPPSLPFSQATQISLLFPLQQWNHSCQSHPYIWSPMPKSMAISSV